MSSKVLNAEKRPSESEVATTNADFSLPRWMHIVLRIAGGYNLLAGFGMMVLYHEGFQLLGIAKPNFVLPIQLTGLLVALFGVGYLMVDRRPQQNAGLLLLGIFSKALGPLLALRFILDGSLPLIMLAVLFLSDIVYVLPFLAIYRHIVTKPKF